MVRGAFPRLADRIVRMAEEEARHRREGDQHDRKLGARGQSYGFVIVLFSFAVAGVLVDFDRSLYGMGAVIAAVGGLSGLFVWSRSKSAKEGPGLPERGKGGRGLRGPQGG